MAAPRRAARRTIDRVALSLVRSGRSVQFAQLRIGLGVPPQEALGVSVGDRIEVLWGEGPDVGRILLSRGTHEKGVRLLAGPSHKRSHYCYARSGNLPDHPFPGADGRGWKLDFVPRKTEHVDFACAAGGIVVELPSSWWSVTDSSDAQADRLEAMLSRGASEAMILRALGVSEERLAEVKRHALQRRRLFRPIGAAA